MKVRYHSGRLCINPNLYNCGKVCLSLLGTWSGQYKNENWIPGISTVLQVLVSIQGLILNSKPYFNEPGYGRSMNMEQGESTAMTYNEDTFILPLRTMIYNMKKPPKHFEDLVRGRFFKCAPGILMAVKRTQKVLRLDAFLKVAYEILMQIIGAAPAPAPPALRMLYLYISLLGREFERPGVKDLEKFMPPASAPVTTME